MIKMNNEDAAEVVRMLNSYTEELYDRIENTPDEDQDAVRYFESELADVETIIGKLEVFTKS